MSRRAYSEQVLALFSDPQHGGELGSGFAGVASGNASASSNGPHVVINAGLEADRLASMSFQAFGGPHLIAAAEWVCREYEGGPASLLKQFRADHLAEVLDIPIENTGHILLLEDAIQSLLKKLGIVTIE